MIMPLRGIVDMNRERFGEEYHEENKSCTGSSGDCNQCRSFTVEYAVSGSCCPGSGKRAERPAVPGATVAGQSAGGRYCDNDM